MLKVAQRCCHKGYKACSKITRSFLLAGPCWPSGTMIHADTLTCYMRCSAFVPCTAADISTVSTRETAVVVTFHERGRSAIKAWSVLLLIVHAPHSTYLSLSLSLFSQAKQISSAAHYVLSSLSLRHPGLIAMPASLYRARCTVTCSLYCCRLARASCFPHRGRTQYGQWS